MNLQVIIAIVVTAFVNNIFFSIIGLIVFIRWYMWRTKNNLDIVICELTRNGVVIRKEIGRRELGKNGWQVVTARFMKKKYKDNLGYNITEDDMTPSGHGRKRKFLIVAMKDGLTASLKTVVEENDQWTEEELKLLAAIEKSFKTTSPIKLFDIPKSLSLKPVLAEQTRLAIDLARDTVDVEGNDDKKAARRMFLAAAGVFIFAILISFALLVVVITQGQSLASAVAPAATTTATTVAPGVSLPG